MFGPCKVCSERQGRIADLKAQIEDLRKLVFVAQDTSRSQVVELEADAMLSGAHENIPEISLTEEQKAEKARLLDEAVRVLTANY